MVFGYTEIFKHAEQPSGGTEAPMPVAYCKGALLERTALLSLLRLAP